VLISELSPTLRCWPVPSNATAGSPFIAGEAQIGLSSATLWLA